MSSTLHAQIINCRQQEVATRAIHVARAAEASALVRRGHRAIRRRVVGALAALAAAGFCIAVATATPVSAQTSQPLFRVGHTASTSGQTRRFTVASGATAVDPARFAAGVRRLERNGYVQWLCTKTGMLMHDARTGRFATVRW
jgi:hypothetical protein